MVGRWGVILVGLVVGTADYADFRRWAVMPLHFVPGFWIDVPSAEAPACAGMTAGGCLNRGLG